MLASTSAQFRSSGCQSRQAAAPGPHTRWVVCRAHSRLSRGVCYAVGKSASSKVIQEARQAAAIGVEPVYLNAAGFLKSIGFKNQAEISRVLDIAMNPDSLFLTYQDYKRAVNASARPLDVENDMRPVVEFLAERGVQGSQLVEIISKHPPVLSYSIENRLKPFWDYLENVGVKDVGKVIAQRPTLLGLDVNGNLHKIVDYLQYTGTPPETIVKYLAESI